MNGWLLDTNVIGSLAAPNGAPSVKTWVRSRDEVDLYISILTLAEYDKGIAQLADGDPRRAQVARLRDGIRSEFESRILPVSDAVVRRWGEMAGRIRRDTGHPPPVVDTMLAATAVEHGLCLVTRNTRDVASTGALLFDPWRD